MDCTGTDDYKMINKNTLIDNDLGSFDSSDHSVNDNYLLLNYTG